MASGSLRVVVCLGHYAWQALWPQLELAGYRPPKPRPAFGHGVEVTVGPPAQDGAPLIVLGCYHPSQQNTFTGRVTEPMLDAVFSRARDLAGTPPG
jgi:uracil-DNA glycosylase